MCFNFWFCFFRWYLDKHCKLCSRIKFCAIAAGIKKYKSIIKKKRKKYNRTVLPAKTKLNTIEVFVSKALIKSYFIHDEFLSEYNV